MKGETWNVEVGTAGEAASDLHIIDFSRQISKISPDDIWLGYVLRYGIED
jgi:hypothetical protein